MQMVCFLSRRGVHDGATPCKVLCTSRGVWPPCRCQQLHCQQSRARTSPVCYLRPLFLMISSAVYCGGRRKSSYLHDDAGEDALQGVPHDGRRLPPHRLQPLHHQCPGAPHILLAVKCPPSVPAHTALSSALLPLPSKPIQGDLLIEFTSTYLPS